MSWYCVHAVDQNKLDPLNIDNHNDEWQEEAYDLLSI